MTKLDKRIPFKLLRLLLVLSATLLLNACGPGSHTTEQHIERGLRFEQQGDLRSASIEYRNALQLTPSSGEGRFRFGLLLLNQGDAEGARVELNRAKDLGWDLDQLRLPMIRANLMQNRYGRVLDETQLIESFADDQRAEALLFRAQALLGIGNPHTASELLAEALRLRPTLVNAYVVMADATFRLGKEPETVREWLDKALEIDPLSSTAWKFIGGLEQSLGRPEAAESAYTTAIQNANTDAYALHFQRSMVRLTLGDLRGVESDLSAMRRLGPAQGTTSFVEGLVHIQQGQYAEATTAMQETLRRNPGFQSAHLILGASHLAQGQWQQANHNLQRFRALQPDNAEAARLLAIVRAQQGELETAEDLLRSVVEQNPEDSLALGMMGNVQLASGQRTAGLESLRRLSLNDPDHIATRAIIARELLVSGELAAAARELEGLIERAPGSEVLDLTLINTLIQAEEFEKAFEAIERLHQRFPDNPLPWNLRGALHLTLGNIEDGRRAIAEALALNPGDPWASDMLAQLALQRGEFEEALRVLRESHTLHSEHLGVMLQLARLEAIHGDPAEAARVLERAISIHPDSKVARSALARLYISQSDPERALVVLEPALQEGADKDLETLTLLFRAQLSSGQMIDAAATLRLIADIVPASADMHYQLAMGFEEARELETAASHLRLALELDDGHLDAHRSLAMLEFNMGNVDEALVLARAIQEKASEIPDGYTIEGQILVATNRVEEGITAFRKALEVSPSAELAIGIGFAYLRVGDPLAGIDALRSFLGKHPEEVKARLALATLLREQGQEMDAILEYKEVINGEPDNVVALNNLAVLYDARNDERALGYAERAKVLLPNDPRVAATLGWILVQRGDLERGVPLLEKARIAAPDIPEIRYQYAVSLVEAGQEQEALNELEALLAEADRFAQREAAETLYQSLR